MIEIRQTDRFATWLAALRDPVGRAKIANRVQRLATRNPGGVRPIGGGVSELRIHWGPGYRVYFVRRGAVLVILLCGGDKGSQRHDIAAAQDMARELE